MEFSMMFMFLLLGGGNNTGDLLDYTDINNYWEMRDQRVIDLDTMSAVLADDDATATDTLMAIRSIAEWVLIQEADPDIEADPADKVKALKVLAPLVDSKEPFVGRYAKRSIAFLKGEDPPGYDPLPEAVFDQDLALLPSDASLVGQMKIANGVGPIHLAGLIPDVEIEGRSMRDMMMAEMLPGLMQAVQTIGNVRADLVTLGMNLESEEEFHLVLAIRGQYDRVALQLVMEEEFGEDDNTSFYSVGDVEVVAVNQYDPFAILMPSDDMFVLLFAEDREAKLPIDEVAKKLAKADRKPKFGIDVAEQVDAINREKADLWMAMKVTKLISDEPDMRETFGAFDAGRAFATRDTEGMLDVKWFADGSNEAATGKAVKGFQDLIQEGITEITREKKHMPPGLQQMMNPMLDMMKSMTFEQQGTNMSGGMKIDPSIGMTMPMMMMPMRSNHGHDHGPALEAEDAADDPF